MFGAIMHCFHECRRRAWNAWKEERGSSTIEATLVLPVIFLLSILLMIAAVYFFQSERNYLVATRAADRMAHTWDNSNKHPVTGMYTPIQQDPLYWRLLNDGAEYWFFSGAAVPSTSIQFPVTDEEADSLIVKKLRRGTEELPYAMSGQAAFINRGWMKSVKVDIVQPFQAPSILGVRFASVTGGGSFETIVEPAEFIRNIDMVRSYLAMIGQSWEQGTLQNMLAPWINSGGSGREFERLEFAVHAEAVRYLRSLVRGRESRIDTEQTGSWRLIDALDGQEIAHQAYLGAKTLNGDMRFQLMKDVELLRKGEVKGVVWHFFRRTGTEIYGPNPSLRRELEKYGIAIVVHH